MSKTDKPDNKQSSKNESNGKQVNKESEGNNSSEARTNIPGSSTGFNKNGTNNGERSQMAKNDTDRTTGSEVKQAIENTVNEKTNKNVTPQIPASVANKVIADTQAAKEAVKSEKIDSTKEARAAVITSNSNSDGRLAKESTSVTEIGSVSDGTITQVEQNAISFGLAKTAIASELTLRAVRLQSTFLTQVFDTLGQFEIKFHAPPKIVDYSAVNKIVDAPPQLLQLFSDKTDNDLILSRYYYDNKFKGDFPDFVKKTLEIFQVGTATVKVKIDSLNTTLKIQHDPDLPISSARELVKPVRLTSMTMTEHGAPQISIGNVLDGVVNLMLQIIGSCRVIISNVKFKTIANEDNRRGLPQFLGLSKIPDTLQPHIMFNIGHPLEWFESDIVEMIDSNVAEFRVGEISVDDYVMGYGKRRRRVNFPSDQYAAHLNGIHFRRRQVNRMLISDYYAHIYAFAMPGISVTFKDHILNDNDYEFMGITQYMKNAFLTLYTMSNQFKNGITMLMQDYALQFGIIHSNELSSVIARINDIGLVPASEKHISYLEQHFRTISESSFINAMLMNLLSGFYQVRVSTRVAKGTTDKAMFDLLSNLIMLFLFPAIARQNLHILAHNIMSILYGIEFTEAINFISAFGFAQNISNVTVLSDEQYFTQKIIPTLFDRSVNINGYPTLAKIRALVFPKGKNVRIVETVGVNLPCFDDTRTVFMPWVKTSRKVGQGMNDLKTNFIKSKSIIRSVLRSYGQTNDIPRSQASATQTILSSMDIYVDEFCQAMHHEGYDLYYAMARHWGYLYNSMKTPEDVYRPDDLRFGVVSSDNIETRPWSLPKEEFTMDWTFGLSAMLTISGILKPLTDNSSNTQIKVTYPDPRKIFHIYYNVMHGSMNAMEPYVMAKLLLSNNGNDTISKLIMHEIYNAGLRGAYLETLYKLFEGSSAPSDLLEFSKQQLAFRNKLVLLNPKIVQVNRASEVHIDNRAPSIVDRELIIEDPFLREEFDVAQRMIFSENSIAMKFGKGITIRKTEAARVSPNNPPAYWANAEYKKFDPKMAADSYGPSQVELLGTTFLDGQNKIGYYDPKTQRWYTDFDACNFPKIVWTFPHPTDVSHRYLPYIKKLIMRGLWSFEFTDLQYQASVVYLDKDDLGPSFAEDMISRIFDAKTGGVTHLIFLDNTAAVYSIYDTPVYNPSAQYIFPQISCDEVNNPHANRFQRNIVAKSIYGEVGAPLTYKQLDSDNWRAGSNTNGYVPMFEYNRRKVDTGIPNFLNTFVVDDEKGFIRTFPELEVRIPAFYFDAN